MKKFLMTTLAICSIFGQVNAMNGTEHYLILGRQETKVINSSTIMRYNANNFNDINFKFFSINDKNFSDPLLSISKTGNVFSYVSEPNTFSITKNPAGYDIEHSGFELVTILEETANLWKGEFKNESGKNKLYVVFEDLGEKGTLTFSGKGITLDIDFFGDAPKLFINSERRVPTEMPCKIC